MGSQLRASRDSSGQRGGQSGCRVLSRQQHRGDRRCCWATFLEFRGTGNLQGWIPTSDAISSIAYSPSGNLIAAGGTGGYLTVWEVATRRELWSASLGNAGTSDIVAVLCAIVGLALLILAYGGVSLGTSLKLDASWVLLWSPRSVHCWVRAKPSLARTVGRGTMR